LNSPGNNYKPLLKYPQFIHNIRELHFCSPHFFSKKTSIPPQPSFQLPPNISPIKIEPPKTSEPTKAAKEGKAHEDLML